MMDSDRFAGLAETVVSKPCPCLENLDGIYNPGSDFTDVHWSVAELYSDTSEGSDHDDPDPDPDEDVW